jgi:hypothetical protein
MLTYDEAAQMAWDAFMLTPEGEGLHDTVTETLHKRGIPDTHKNRVVLTARIILADRRTNQIVWPVLAQLLQEAEQATHARP